MVVSRASGTLRASRLRQNEFCLIFDHKMGPIPLNSGVTFMGGGGSPSSGGHPHPLLTLTFFCALQRGWPPLESKDKPRGYLCTPL